MIPGSLDRVICAFFPDTHTRLTIANVTDTARTLERNHLCGPTAGLIQAELVGGATLLGTQLERPGQAISLRLNLPEGAIGGASIECTAAFTVRGYTRQKVLADLDDATEITDEEVFQKALGTTAQCGVVISEGTSATNALFNVTSKHCISIADVIEEYFHSSLQRTALVQISGASEKGYVSCVHAMMCECFPETDSAVCERIEERFDTEEIARLLNNGADLQTIAAALGLGEATDLHEHPVRFACPCSSERVMTMLSSLPKPDLEAMIAEGKTHDIFCHMCGKGFSVTPEQLKMLL